LVQLLGKIRPAGENNAFSARALDGELDPQTGLWMQPAHHEMSSLRMTVGAHPLTTAIN
jgi:hypothetical protein